MANVVLVDSNAGGLATLEAARSLGHTVTFIRSRRFAPIYRSAVAEKFIGQANHVVEIENSLDTVELSKVLLAERDRIGIDALLTVNDFSVQAVADVAEQFGIRTTNHIGVRRARQKDLCRRLVEAAGIPSVGHVLISTREEARAAADSIGYPVVIKPSTGTASVGAARLRTPVELETFFDEWDEARRTAPMGISSDFMSKSLLIEQFVEGPLMSVEIGCSADGTIYPFMVTRRTIDAHNPVLEMASTMPAPLPEWMCNEAVNQARTIVRTLGLELGVFHVEFIASEQGPRLVEVNPRLMGGNLPALYKHSTGVSMFEMLLRLHLGENLSQLPGVRRAVCSRLIAAAKAERIRRAPTPAEMDSLRERTIVLNLSVKEGQPVEEFLNSFGSFGHFVVEGHNPQQACDNAELMVTEISHYLGISLK